MSVVDVVKLIQMIKEGSIQVKESKAGETLEVGASSGEEGVEKALLENFVEGQEVELKKYGLQNYFEYAGQKGVVIDVPESEKYLGIQMLSDNRILYFSPRDVVGGVGGVEDTEVVSDEVEDDGEEEIERRREIEDGSGVTNESADDVVIEDSVLLQKAKASENRVLYTKVLERMQAYKKQGTLTKERAIAMFSDFLKPIAHMLYIEQSEELLESSLPYDEVVRRVAQKLVSDELGNELPETFAENTVDEGKKKLTPKQIRQMPTIDSGHFSDFKYDDGKLRIAVSRLTRADGAKVDHEIEVEKMVNGVWKSVSMPAGGILVDEKSEVDEGKKKVDVEVDKEVDKDVKATDKGLKTKEKGKVVKGVAGVLDKEDEVNKCFDGYRGEGTKSVKEKKIDEVVFSVGDKVGVRNTRLNKICCVELIGKHGRIISESEVDGEKFYLVQLDGVDEEKTFEARDIESVTLAKLEESRKITPAFGVFEKYAYAVKIEGLDNQDFFRQIFGRQLGDLRKVQAFMEEAKVYYVDAKGKPTMSAVKLWVKENKPEQFYARWQADSSYYHDDTVDIYCKGVAGIENAPVEEKKLTTAGRKHIAPENFVYPKERKYPIHDISHARNALARVSANGTPAEKSKVRAVVYAKYPSLKEGKIAGYKKLIVKNEGRIPDPKDDAVAFVEGQDIQIKDSDLRSGLEYAGQSGKVEDVPESGNYIGVRMNSDHRLRYFFPEDLVGGEGQSNDMKTETELNQPSEEERAELEAAHEDMERRNEIESQSGVPNMAESEVEVNEVLGYRMKESDRRVIYAFIKGAKEAKGQNLFIDGNNLSSGWDRELATRTEDGWVTPGRSSGLVSQTWINAVRKMAKADGVLAESKINESDKNPLYFIMRAVNRINSGDKDGASWVFANEMDDQDRYKFDNNGVRPKNSTPSPQPYNYLLFYFKERVNNALNIYNGSVEKKN